MNEDLKWLAENAHDIEEDRWYANINGELRSWPGSVRRFWLHAFRGAAIKSARDELSGKPSWDDHNHNFVCQNNNGRWFGYDIEPIKLERDQCWSHADLDILWQGRRVLLGKGEVLGDWRNTLERRPCVSESAKSNKQQVLSKADDKQWRGPEDGLPPVGARIEYRTGGDEGFYVGEILCYHEKSGNVWILEEMDGEPCTFSVDATEFRPIRTEEDNAVEDMMQIWTNTTGTDGQRMQALYRSGLRFKQETEK